MPEPKLVIWNEILGLGKFIIRQLQSQILAFNEQICRKVE